MNNAVILVVLILGMVVGDNTNFQVTAGNFVVSVTGNENVPKYNYWLQSAPLDTYSVKFDLLYETTGNGNARAGTVGLASLSYVFSNPVDNGNETTFNITSGPANQNQFTSLRIVNHLGKQSNTTSLKFDIFVDNYVWQSNTAGAKLVISFAFTGGSHGFFTSHPTATATSGIIAVTLSDQGGEKYLTYDHFTGSLEHDPTFGISNAQMFKYSLVLLVVVLVLLIL